MFTAQSVGSDVHVWVFEVDDDVTARRAAYLLPPDECDRLGRAAEPHRRRGVCAHAGLRILAAAAGGGTPALVDLARGDHGEPYLAATPWLHVSLAHSGVWAAVALSTAGRVGVDIETLTPLPELDGLARLILAEPEHVQWRGGDAATRAALLLQAWTRKEAVLKALGLGLAGGMRSVVTALSVGAPEPVQVRALAPGAGPAAGWTVRDLSPGGYLGAVAVQATDVQLHVHHVTMDELLSDAERYPVERDA